MKRLNVLFMAAVIAAAGMLAGCDAGLAGSGDEAAEAYISETAYSSGSKKITVRFVVCNGGWGLVQSGGIVSPADDSCFLYNSGSWANDFYITIPVAKADSYVNIRWQCTDALSRKFWVKGTMPVRDAGKYSVVLDFNEEKNTDGWDIDTQNLKEVYEYGPGGTHEWLTADWDEARGKSVKYNGPAEASVETEEDADSAEASGSPSGLMASASSGGFFFTRAITVNFEVLNGGTNIVKYSEAMVSWANDKFIVCDGNSDANDFSITVPVRSNQSYLNIRWRGENKATRYNLDWPYLKARLRLDSFTGDVITITLTCNDGTNVAVTNLEDVRIDPYFVNKGGLKLDFSELHKDWDAVQKRSVRDEGSESVITAGANTRLVTVNFEVKDDDAGSGYKLKYSDALVSWPEDRFVVSGTATFANDYSIKIPVRPGQPYLNVRWHSYASINGADAKNVSDGYLKAKLNLDSFTGDTVTVVVNYSGIVKMIYKLPITNSRVIPNIATTNLVDVHVGGNAGSGKDKDIIKDWENAQNDWNSARGRAFDNAAWE